MLVADERPVLDQINLVVRDMDATVEFYARLGVEIAPSVAQWARHHRALSAPGGLDFDLDSTEFATRWNSGWPPGQTGVVIGFRLASREAVDATYDDLTRAGYAGQQPPFDAFWGARYAVVADPRGELCWSHEPGGPHAQHQGTNTDNLTAAPAERPVRGPQGQRSGPGGGEGPPGG